MIRAKTTALMVFHQPFLSTIAAAFPDSDVLMGKPMPINAAERFYRTQPKTPFEPAQQLQWLIDSHERLQQYQSLGRQLGVRLRINLEIDVGLHRGGLGEPAALEPILATIADDPEHLQLSGFMGYEPHLTGLAAGLDHPAVQNVLALYRGFLDRIPASCLVDEFDPGTVEFGFGHVLDFFFELECPAHPIVKREHLGGAHGVVEREHRYAVFDRCETLAGWSADSPSRGIRSSQLGVLRFERHEFPVHRVVFGVRDFRAVFQVIEPTVEVERVDQLVDSARSRGLFSRARHGSSDLIKAAARARAASGRIPAHNWDRNPIICLISTQVLVNNKKIALKQRPGRGDECGGAASLRAAQLP